MLFNSFQFIIFFPCVVILYWILPAKLRNYMLLIASFYFYMNWQPEFGLLLAGAGFITWGGARLIEYYADKPILAKRIFSATIIILIAALFTFKYLSFFADEVFGFLVRYGLAMAVPHFEILLPVGISFFTFQALGYIIDERRSTIRAEKSLLTVLLFLAFFPQLVAGPIERAKDLLPQFRSRHIFDFSHLMAGLEMMALGYFMKICVAESLSPYVDRVYDNLAVYSGLDILLATFFFCFQIFSDFGGYSLIAIGAARCMGFRLTQNFRQPYLATSVRDFWRRWHVSLSRWLSDYVYIPLGGNRVRPARHYFNIFITLFLSGVWHGADYTFFAWGAYHGSLQAAQAAWHKKSRFHLPKNLFTTILKILMTFFLVLLGRVFFRSGSIGDSMIAFRKIFTEHDSFHPGSKILFFERILMIVILMAIECRHEWIESRLGSPSGSLTAARSERSIYRSAFFLTFIILLIVLFGNFNTSPFIYFNF